MQETFRPYYVDKGRGHDYLVRCKDCRRLVTCDKLFKDGATPCCGNRKVVEVRGLTPWEWFKIRIGFIDFPDRSLFLKEFSPWRTNR